MPASPGDVGECDGRNTTSVRLVTTERNQTGTGRVQAIVEMERFLDGDWLHRSRTHVGGLKGRQRTAIERYTGEDHTRINGWLRRGRQPPDPRLTARVRAIDAVLSRHPLQRTTRLTRTIDLSAFGLASGAGLVKLVGQVRSESGYLSTTRFPDGGAAKRYSNPVRLIVIAPIGTPAAAIEDVSQFPGQGEVLLGRRRRYTLLTPAYDSDVRMWLVTMAIEREATP